jgi:hypothetical protein
MMISDSTLISSSPTELMIPINASNPQEWDEFSRHCTEIISSTLTSNPSCLREGLKITLVIGGGLLSYLVCIPSFLTAGKFNPFPGASMISSIATMVNYGTFGADQYRELATIIFEESRYVSGKKSAALKVFLVATSVILAALSRLPYAGLTLHVAPGIPQQWRLSLAVAGIIGTSSPEAVSTYRTLTLRVSKSNRLSQTLTGIYLNIAKNNFIKCLKGAKLILLTAPPGQRIPLLQKYKQIFRKTSANNYDNQLLADFINSIATMENWKKKRQKSAVKRQRFVVRHLTATTTTTATLCSQFNNACLTKLAFDYFVPTPKYDVVKWIGAALCTVTLSYTSLLLTYKSAMTCLDSVSALWGNKQHYTFAEAYYPVSDFLGGVFAYFWAACLYGIVYEATAATVNMSKSYGMALFIGNFAATFLLISYIMKNVIGSGIRLHAGSRFANPIAKDAGEFIKKLDDVKTLLKEKSIKDFAVSLKRLSLAGLLCQETYDILSTAYPKHTLETTFNLEEVLDSIQAYTKASKKEKTRTPGELTPLIIN